MEYKKKVYLNGMTGEMLPCDIVSIANDHPEQKNLNGRSKFQSSEHTFYVTPLCLEYADDYYNFKVRKSDVFVMGFPKSGTSWMQEIIWTLLHNPHLNNPEALSIPLYARSLYFEDDTIGFHLAEKEGIKNHITEKFIRDCPDGNPKRGFFLQLLETYEDPRVMKTHLPFCFFRKEMVDTAKFVYIFRDYKSLLPSTYDFLNLLNPLKIEGNFDDFVNYFMEDKSLFGSYWNHVEEAWNLRKHQNVLFVAYQDLVDDAKEELKRIAEFLNLELTDTQLKNIQHWCSFSQMKQRAIEHNQDLVESLGFYRKSENEFEGEEKGKFFRKGTGKDWKEALTKEQINRLNDWIKTNSEKFGPDFPRPQ